ncbi:MFS transporter [Mycoplasma marinum]|uniref:Major facilitator superfamily (MFS) profile domain-containing protein n=1 Tax=Mycoplasma marinum TaxID=1937190 RepID=A0A4R0XJS7_9MOLU|nr:MFS transporter [Mycoplasma marinum]TCG10883.1 hypothetical protein C4B24_03665 [Mycoplasma marinum]
MNWIKKNFTHGLSKKIILAVFVLAAVDIFSMAAPYYLKYVIPHIYTYLNVTQDQFDQLNASLGYTVLIFQIPSGIIADKMSGKKLLIISVVMSGIFTILFGIASQGLFPANASLPLLYIIFIGFGISTTLFLWSPLWKVLSQQGGPKDQASLYGLEGSYNGLIGLLFITLIGTFATSLASRGNNNLFYALVYIIAVALFVSGIGVHFFIEETFEKSHLSRKFSEKITNLKNFRFKKEYFKSLEPAKIFRVWLLAFFVMGMYVFETVFAYYLKSYLAIVASAVVVTALAGFRSYGLRLLVSGPFGKWLSKRRSWTLVMLILLTIGMLISLIAILAPGINNNLHSATVNKKLYTILFSIVFVLLGIISWFLVAGRYILIDEIPHTKETYGTIIALISVVSFSTDAWFYQMASSWAKHNVAAFHTGGPGHWSKGYSQHGLQLLFLTATGITLFGIFCGMGAYAINRHEIKKLGKKEYRWRTLDKR